MNNEIYIIARPAQFFTATLFENGQDLVREVTYWEMDSLMNDQFKNYIDRNEVIQVVFLGKDSKYINKLRDTLEEQINNENVKIIARGV